jgi:hypothetical protein
MKVARSFYFGEQVEYLSIFLWFLSGVIFHKALSSVLEFGLLSMTMEKVTNELLISLVLIEQDIQFVVESKKLILKEKGMSEEDIEHHTLLHRKGLQLWKEKVILTLINNYPASFREKLIPFSNWQGATEYVNHLIKQKRFANRK